MTEFTDIPMPQELRLYEVINGRIVEPRLSIESFSNTCTAGNYSSTSTQRFTFLLYNQTADRMQLNLQNSNVSFIGASSYFGINGFSNGLECRLINYSSPTIVFLPLIKATDNSKNIDLTTSIISSENLTNDNLDVNDLILLTTQSVTTENIVYKVTARTGTQITVSQATDINATLTQNQNQIFVRAKVVDDSGTRYFGLYNSTSYLWSSQTISTRLPNADYGLSLSSELSSNQISLSYFSNNGITPAVNEIIAINIPGGGKSSGIYQITRIAGGLVTVVPIYPPYLFVHQFTKVKLDLNTLTQSVWYVNPISLLGVTKLYSSTPFEFLVFDFSFASSAGNWGLQVDGIKNDCIGMTLFTDCVNNNYITQSDTFSFCVKTPSWVGSGPFEGLGLNVLYETNTISVDEEAVIA